MINKISFYLRGLVKKPFKVGLITVNYFGEGKFDGVAIHTYYLSRELAKLGCEVHVFTQDEKNSTKKEYVGAGKIIVHRIKTKINFPMADKVTEKRMTYLLFENSIIQEISKENSHDKFDILHTHNVGTSGAFISKYFHDLKWIHSFHSLEKNRIKLLAREENKYLDIVRWAESTIRYADALIAVSNNLKLEVLQSYSIKEEKVYTIPNGVDLNLFPPENNPQQDKRILYVGRFSLEKGIDILFKIINQTLSENKEVKFVMAVPINKGIAPSLKKIQKKFENLLELYPERFIWHKENIPREKIRELYRDSLIYIQPSRYDSSPTTVLEAMACGKAVIVSNKGGMPEMVGNAGVILPLKTNLFTKEILRLVEDFKLRERYARRAIERSKDFSWEDIAKRTLALYKKVSGQEDKRKGIKEEDKIEIEPKAKLKNNNTHNSLW